MDPVARFLAHKTVRRAVALGAFVGLLVLFRKLIPLLVFFLAFERALGWAAERLAPRVKMSHKATVLALVGLLLAAAGVGAAVGVGRGIHLVTKLRATLPERIASIRESALYERVAHYLPDSVEGYLEAARHYATGAVGYVTAFGHLVVFAIIGLILAVLYRLEEEELDAWTRSIPERSLSRTLLRWFGHLADAVTLTIQLQLIVAVFNAVFTLPILLALGIPHAGALALFIFATSLVPVIGNLVSGAVLIALAYQSRGWLGVGVFVVLTFVLHKIESYYLNPRLTARHVRLPGMVLIASLIAWEHLLGIAGLFASFPFLFVATRIHGELGAEDAEERAPPPSTAEATG